MAAERHLAELTVEERDVEDLFPGPLLGIWKSADRAERQRLADVAVALALRGEGGAALDVPGVRRHLAAICDQMRLGEPGERRAARARWRRISQSTEPSFREVKDSANAVDAAAAYDEAWRRLDGIRRRARVGRRLTKAQLVSELRSAFQGWLHADLLKMADVMELQRQDPQGVRLALLSILGSSIQRSPHTMKDLIARGRRHLNLDRRIAEGRRRYEAWLNLPET
jgi:hypothetical protein